MSDPATRSSQAEWTCEAATACASRRAVSADEEDVTYADLDDALISALASRRSTDIHSPVCLVCIVVVGRSIPKKLATHYKY